MSGDQVSTDHLGQLTDNAPSGFPQVRQNKIPRLFQITLKYFQAFCGAFYNPVFLMILKIWLTFSGQGC